MVVLSLGWGVQSWGMAAMSALGVLSHVDIAIHSDTGFECKATRAFAHRWTPWLEDHGIPVITVHPDIPGLDGLFRGSQAFPLLPVFTRYPPDSHKGMLRRRCSYVLKIMPVRRWINLRKGRCPVDLWVGFSQDEAHRAKPSPVRYLRKHYPLIPTYTRSTLSAWLRSNGLEVPPRSTCVCCPFHSAEAWLRIRACPSDWAAAVDIDAQVRLRMVHRFECYLHRQRVPLDLCDLSR